MSEQRALLRADTIDWLLETDNPSVRYFTLTDIMEVSKDNPEVRRATGGKTQPLSEQRGM